VSKQLSATPVPADTNPYSTALSRLLETVKWLVTVFSASAGLVLAGTTLSELGHFELTDPRFQLALAGLSAGVFFLLLAVRLVVPLLGPTSVFASDLRARVPCWKDGPEERERRVLRAIIARYSSDLLPTGLDSVDKLLDERQRLSEAKSQISSPEGNRHQFRELQAIWDRLDPIFIRFMQFAQYQLAYIRFRRRLNALIFLSILALFGLALYAWAAHPAKPGDPQPPPTPVVACAGAVQAPLLSSIAFAPGRHDVEPSQFARIDVAVGALRALPCEVLLLKAHTDTVAGERVNADLARDRGKVVRDLLIARGGIAGNRIYVAELPRNDLLRPHARSRRQTRESDC